MNPASEPLRLIAVTLTLAAVRHVGLFTSSAHEDALKEQGLADVTNGGLTSEATRLLQGRAPETLTLDGSIGACTSFTLPHPARRHPLLRDARARFVLPWKQQENIVTVLMEVNPEHPDARHIPPTPPGEPVALNMPCLWVRHEYRPDEGHLPPQLVRAIWEDGTTVTIKASRPAPALASSENPLDSEA